jgi:hypothetical protein
MKKPTSNYKMSKTLKMRLASTRYSRELLPFWKRAMIDAELCADHAKKIAGKREKSNEADVD